MVSRSGALKSNDCCPREQGLRAGLREHPADHAPVPDDVRIGEEVRIDVVEKLYPV